MNITVIRKRKIRLQQCIKKIKKDGTTNKRERSIKLTVCIKSYNIIQGLHKIRSTSKIIIKRFKIYNFFHDDTFKYI